MDHAEDWSHHPGIVSATICFFIHGNIDRKGRNTVIQYNAYLEKTRWHHPCDCSVYLITIEKLNGSEIFSCQNFFLHHPIKQSKDLAEPLNLYFLSQFCISKNMGLLRCQRTSSLILSESHSKIERNLFIFCLQLISGQTVGSLKFDDYLWSNMLLLLGKTLNHWKQ